MRSRAKNASKGKEIDGELEIKEEGEEDRGSRSGRGKKVNRTPPLPYVIGQLRAGQCLP